MLGSNVGYVLSQAEIQADLFAEAGYSVWRTSSNPAPIWRLFDTIRSIVSWRNRIDLIIHSVFSGRGFLNTVIVSRLCMQFHIPIVFALHGGALPTFATKHEGWVRRTFNLADAFVAPSNYLANFFGDWGYPVHVIPNVLEMAHYPFCVRSIIKPNLIWMRSFHYLYHPEMAVEVMQIVKQSYPEVKLTMAGSDKGLLQPVKKLAVKKGVNHNINFAGFLDMPGKQRQFAQNDIYLNTNRVDNMPVSVVEAAAFGLPIVATRVGGIPHLLEHEQTGLLVEDANVEEMATAVIRLLNEPELVLRLSQNGRDLAEESSKENVLQKWRLLIQQIINNG